jgi:quinol monooxygenase YgiN
MPYIFVRQKIQDYSKWKAGFDEDIPTRQAGGAVGAQVFRDAEDPNVVSILMQMKDMASVQGLMQRMQTPEMQQLMAASGVMGPPEVVYIFGEVAETSG